MLLSLIVPCYNESKNLNILVSKLDQNIKNKEIELIIVNNGSYDNSLDIISNLLKKYNYIKLVNVQNNIGYGYGLYQGIINAKGMFIGYTHADLQTDPNDIFKIYELLTKENTKTFFKGSRKKRNLYDKFFTKGMSLMSKFILKQNLQDINAQPTVFHHSFLKQVLDPPKDFSFDLYLYYTAIKNNYKIKRFPVFFHKRIYGEAHLKNLKSKIIYSLKTIKYIIWLKKNNNKL